jgi:isoleucyl-tRNA synthetase
MASPGGSNRVEIPVDLNKIFTLTYEFQLLKQVLEHIYQQLLPYAPKEVAQPQSVHLCRYPQPDAKLIQPVLEAAVARMQAIILLGRQKRNQVKIKTKTPLARLTIVHREQTMLDEIARLEDYIKGELNVKLVEYTRNEDDYIRLFAKPNAPVLGKRLGKDFGKFRGLIEKLDATSLNTLQATGSLTIDGTSFGADDILVYREAKAGTDAISDRLITIDMDCTLQPALVQEGLAREVVSRIQKSRKDLGFKVTDRIDISYKASPELAAAIHTHASYIQQETLGVTLDVVTDRELPLQFDIDEFRLGLELKVTYHY